MHINKTTGTGSLERRSRGENTNAESMQGGPNVINRGGNILINEFLQRERKNQEANPGPITSLERINQRGGTDQDNIIISNQERKQEAHYQNATHNRIGDTHW